MAVVKVSRNIPQSAFKEQKTITSVYFGSKCSSVGQDAFSGCISLSEINYNNEIIEIGGGAFAETALSTVKLNKLSKIESSEKQNEYGAFQDCSILTNINIQQCSSIGNNAFYSCTNLKTVNINSKSANVKIAHNAFYNCSSLSDINLKACILIGSNAFYNCGQLSKANLENCKYIYKNAFLNCSSLKEITLSNSKNIDDRVFYNCNNLSIVYVNTQDVIPLGSSVFYSGASIIKNIKFYMQPGAISKFTKDKNWKEYKNHMIETPNSNQIIYTTNDGNQINVNMDGVEHVHVFENDFGKITFKDEVVKQLPESKIFKGKENLTSIYSPFKLETVGEQEFEGCINLDKFMPPQANTLKTIGNYAFKNCTSLKSFKIPESLTSIGEGVFAGCSNIEKFEGKYVKYNKAIVYDDTLISVAQKDSSETGVRYYKISNIDSNIKSLGKSCFYGFKELIRVDIPSNIDRIGENAFDGCDNLQEVHFDGDPSNINFEKNAFGIFVEGNTEEGNTEEGNTIKEGREDFKIFIPESIFKNINFESEENTFIENYGNYIYPEPAEKQILYYLKGKTEYMIEPFNNKLSFEDNIDIYKVIFGEKITKINDSTFKNCTSLEYIYLPDTINAFGNECFYGCSSLKRICIPNKSNVFSSTVENNKDSVIGNDIDNLDLSKITSIGNYAFYGCKNLSTALKLQNKLTSIGAHCFEESGITELDMSKAYKINIISHHAFCGCTNLTNVILPDSIEYIQHNVFENCEKIKEIDLPLKLSKIGNNSFATNGSINIYINENTKIPPKFVYNSGLEDRSVSVMPFGENPYLKDKDLNIFAPTSELCETYKNDKHWKKYAKYIKKYDGNIK